jgi:Xaa-Pro aminopeptidase
VPRISATDRCSELPPAVTEAAKRAFRARRAGVAVAELIRASTDSAAGGRLYQFAHGHIRLELHVHRCGDCFDLRVACGARRGAAVEVMHGGATVRAALDDVGELKVGVQQGLLSVLVYPSRPTQVPIQTAWLRFA